jgi:hypothetical protein
MSTTEIKEAVITAVTSAAAGVGTGAGIELTDISMAVTAAVNGAVETAIASATELATEKVMEAVPESIKHHPLFEEALKQLKAKLGDVELTPASLTKAMRAAMEVIEDLPIKGAAQKDLAVDILRQLITDAPIEEAQKKLCQDVIDSGILASTIDLVVSASKGELNLNRAAEMAADVAAAASSKWPCCGTIATLLRSVAGKRAPAPPAIRRRRH